MGTHVVVDSGILIALARGDAVFRRYVEAIIEEGFDVTVPAVAVAETIRGGARDAPLNRFLRSVDVDELDEETARRAGALLAAAGSDQTIDAIVVATASSYVTPTDPCIVLTRDEVDFTALAAHAPGVRIDSR